MRIEVVSTFILTLDAQEKDGLRFEILVRNVARVMAVVLALDDFIFSTLHSDSDANFLPFVFLR